MMSDTYFRNYKTMPHSNEKVIWQRTKPQPNIPDEMQPEEQLNSKEDSIEETATEKRSVYGYVYHNEPQTLAVKMPGEVVPVCFGNHTVLSGLLHDADSPDIKVTETGIYEIGYMVILQSAMAAHAALSLQADGKTIEGSLTTRLLNAQESVYSGAVLAEIEAGSAIRLVITSGTALSAQLLGSGVSASMMIKKLD